MGIQNILLFVFSSLKFINIFKEYALLDFGCFEQKWGGGDWPLRVCNSRSSIKNHRITTNLISIQYKNNTFVSIADARHVLIIWVALPIVYSCPASTAASETRRGLTRSPTTTIWTRGIIHPNSGGIRKWRRCVSPEPALSRAWIDWRGGRGGSEDTSSALRRMWNTSPPGSITFVLAYAFHQGTIPGICCTTDPAGYTSWRQEV